ncbi:hypothetical protein ABPG72_002388 [Tetrahymena utriculariae]
MDISRSKMLTNIQNGKKNSKEYVIIPKAILMMLCLIRSLYCTPCTTNHFQEYKFSNSRPYNLKNISYQYLFNIKVDIKSILMNLLFGNICNLIHYITNNN